MNALLRVQLVALVLVLVIVAVAPFIQCEIGWGQRGLLRNEGVSWPRACKDGHYCFEAVTSDIEQVRRLIDFPWDDYYRQYYIRGCGGSFGMPNNIHPFKGKPKYYRTTPLFIKINITTPPSVTGVGGTELMSLNYHCRKDFCSGAKGIWNGILIPLTMTIAASVYMWVL